MTDFLSQIELKHVLVALVLLYSAVWIAIGLKTGVMTTGRAKFRRTEHPRQFWTQFGIRATLGGLALYLLLAGF